MASFVDVDVDNLRSIMSNISLFKQKMHLKVPPNIGLWSLHLKSGTDDKYIYLVCVFSRIYHNVIHVHFIRNVPLVIAHARTVHQCKPTRYAPVRHSFNPLSSGSFSRQTSPEKGGEKYPGGKYCSPGTVGLLLFCHEKMVRRWALVFFPNLRPNLE